MSLYQHLLDTRSKEDLAKLLVATAKENAALRNEAALLRHEVFWLKVHDQNMQEQAAKICDGLSKLYNQTDAGFDVGYTMAAERAAKEIRELT